MEAWLAISGYVLYYFAAGPFSILVIDCAPGYGAGSLLLLTAPSSAGFSHMDKPTTTCPVCGMRYAFTNYKDRCPICCPKDEPEEVFEDYELVDELPDDD
jgi:hypothetical protein